MGIVYLARHATLGRPAAVKVLRPAFSSDHGVVSRFFNEARAATAVRHPGVIEVYDFGFLEDRTAYIIMEYLDGESLAARIRRRASTIRFTLATIRAIAGALQAVHDHDIVHRDLKPDNVYLIQDQDLPTGYRIKLLDFGIAKLTPLQSDVRQTTAGTVLGTPLYMSPEQCRGSDHVDHRADLYSLGCITYEMLCGQPPFAVQGPSDVMARHLYFDPPPMRLHRSDISAELEAVVLRLLRKEPKARHRSAQELIHAIDQLMALTPPEDLISDNVPTVPLPPSQASGTTLTSAAAQTSEARKAAPHDRRLMLLAGVPTLAIAMIVLIIILVGNNDDERNRATPPGRAPNVAPAPDAGAGIDKEVDARPEAPANARVASKAPGADGSADGTSHAVSPPAANAKEVGQPGLAIPEHDSDATKEPRRVEEPTVPKSARPPTAKPSSPDVPAAKLSEDRATLRTQAPESKRWLKCSTPTATVAAGAIVRVRCQVFNTDDRPVHNAKYSVRAGVVPPTQVEGPSELPAHSASALFSIDVAIPVNPNAEALGVSVYLTAPSDVKYIEEIRIPIADPAKATTNGAAARSP